ncbi:MAG: metallophosphoesterase [Methylococcaceae bacterium]
MNIFLMSDIHSEHVPSSADPDFDNETLKYTYPDAVDVVVLAGDIGEGTNGLVYARNRFANKEIVYVAGNHEYYESDLSIVHDMRIKAKELGIHFLENDSVTINNVKFLGTTLWTDFNNYSHAAIAEAARNMCDYDLITCKKWWLNKDNREKAFQQRNLDISCDVIPTAFTPTVAYLLHREAMNWLDKELNKPHIGKTVIVTHHAPFLNLNIINKHAYASNLEHFITENADKIDLWCHGHIHQPVDYEMAGVRIVSNPRGYPSFPCTLFNDEKTICL